MVNGHIINISVSFQAYHEKKSKKNSANFKIHLN